MWIDDLLSRSPVACDGNNLIYSANGSAEWQRRQLESVERYEDESYEEDPTLGSLFGNFIATRLADRDAIVLDIGCGLFPEPPHYVAQLGLSRFLGLEPLTIPVDRSYPCLVGAIGEDLPLKDGSVDAVIFGTSMDHIGDIDAAIAETKRVLAPKGSIFIWQGMSDPILQAEQKTFARLFDGPLTMKRAIRLAFPQLDALVAWRRMRHHAVNLASGGRIDPAHERWWTRETFARDLERWELHTERELMVPGTASLFVEARPPHRPSPSRGR